MNRANLSTAPINHVLPNPSMVQETQLKPQYDHIDMFEKKVASHDHYIKEDKQRWEFFQKTKLETKQQLAEVKKKGNATLGFVAATLFKELGQHDLSAAYLKDTQGPSSRWWEGRLQKNLLLISLLLDKVLKAVTHKDYAYNKRLGSPFRKLLRKTKEKEKLLYMGLLRGRKQNIKPMKKKPWL